MNLRARFSGLIFLSALLFFSCEEDITTVGLPPENNLGIFFADIPLGDKVTQVWVDDVNTRANNIILVGSYQDPNFGLIEAKNYSEISFSNITFDSDATLDSAVLRLRISSLNGNNIEDVEHTFEVFQLADSISLNDNGESRVITNSSSEPIAAKIGEYSFMLYPDSVGLSFANTNIDLNDGDNDSLDSTFYEENFDPEDFYIYQHKAKLNDTFSQTIFDELITNQYETAVELAALFKGIHLRSSGVNGSIVSYIQGAYSGITFYYKEDGESKIASYPVSTNLSYNNIAPNNTVGWSGSDFDALSNFYEPYETGNDNVYLQTGTNLIAKVDLSGIRSSFLDTIPDVIIQNAEIVIENVDDNDGLAKPQVLRYWLTSTDSLENGNYTAAGPPTLNNSPLAAVYDDENSNYEAGSTILIEFLASSDDFEFDQLVVAPVGSSTLSINGSFIRRLVFNKNDFRLRIHYTLPNR